MASADRWGKILLTAVDLSAFHSVAIASHPNIPLNYISTPKNACSTIKATLLKAVPPISVDNPDWRLELSQWHAAFNRCFCRSRIDTAKKFFCLSRNPYERAISAYQDKIGKGRDPRVWGRFCSKYSVDPDTQPTFSEFLMLLRADPSRCRMDAHFRPQVYTNNSMFVRPHFIGRVEMMSETADFLRSAGLSMVNFKPHERRLRVDRRTINGDEADMIQEIYAEDFEHYGYDLDPRSDFIPEPVYQEQIVSSELETLALWRGHLEVGDLEALAAEHSIRREYSVAAALLRRALMLDTSNSDLLSKLIELEGSLDSDRAVWAEAEAVANRLISIWGNPPVFGGCSV